MTDPLNPDQLRDVEFEAGDLIELVLPGVPVRHLIVTGPEGEDGSIPLLADPFDE